MKEDIENTLDLAETLDLITMDKSERKFSEDAWRELAGPWQGEPDHVAWRDRATDYPCIIHRNALGALCGYVGVPEGHPAFGRGYDDVDVSVHGGLTYAAPCEGNICHVKREDEPERYWLGFDCAHAWDEVPGLVAFRRMMPKRMHISGKDDSYKGINYVHAECTQLAAQLFAMQ